MKEKYRLLLVTMKIYSSHRIIKKIILYATKNKHNNSLDKYKLLIN